MTDTTVLDDTREPLKLPAFERAVMMAVTRALESWREEAMEGTCSYVMCLVDNQHDCSVAARVWAPTCIPCLCEMLGIRLVYYATYSNGVDVQWQRPL